MRVNRKHYLYVNYILALLLQIAGLLLIGSRLHTVAGLWYTGLLVLMTAVVQFLLIQFVSNRWKAVMDQLGCVALVPFLFTTVLWIKHGSLIGLQKGNVTFFYVLLVISGTLLYLALSNWITGLTHSSLKKFVRQHKYMLGVLLFMIVIRIPYMDQYPIWDSAEYYVNLMSGATSCDFTSFMGFKQTFALCNHPTLIFSMVNLIGEYLFPGHTIGVNLVAMVLTVVAFWCLYRILQKILTKGNNLTAALGTLVISMAPMVYGSASYFTPDYYLGMFFVILLYACCYQKTILIGVLSLSCFQTKETGLVIVGGLAIGIILHDLIEHRKNGPIKAVFTDLRLYWILLATMIQSFYNRFTGGMVQWTQTDGETAGLKWDSLGTNCLGFRPHYILLKLKQQCVLNFNWIFMIMIVAGILYLVIRYRKKAAVSLYFCEIAGALGAYGLFSCLYITAALARYNVVGDILLYMMAFLVMEQIISRKVLSIVELALLILVGVQSFITIDPLTKACFITLSYGDQSIVYVGDDDKPVEFLDYMVYNTQFLMINHSLDQMLDESGYNPEDWDVITADGTGGCIQGYICNWDTVKRRRTYYTNEDTVSFGNSFAVDGLGVLELKQKAVFFYMPYVEDKLEDCLSVIADYYDIGEKQTIQTVNGSLSYYVLTLK